MPHSAKFVRGRRAANRDTRAGRYRQVRFPYPTQSEFPRAEYVDPQDRRYCVATGWEKRKPGQRPTDAEQRQARGDALRTAGERADRLVRLNVLFPHGQAPKERRFAQDEALDLMPLLAGLGRQRCRFVRMDARREPDARTCAIYVADFDHSL